MTVALSNHKQIFSYEILDLFVTKPAKPLIYIFSVHASTEIRYQTLLYHDPATGLPMELCLARGFLKMNSRGRAGPSRPSQTNSPLRAEK